MSVFATRTPMFICLGMAAMFLMSLTQPVAAEEAWKAEWDKTVAAAKKEGRVVLYMRAYSGVTREFAKKYPEIKPVTVMGEGSVIGARILSERRAGKYLADFYIGGPHTVLSSLIPAEALDPISEILILPEVLDNSAWLNGRIPYADAERKYSLAFLASPGSDQFTYNTDLVDPKTITSYRDLLDPKWKGKILSMDPTQRHIGGSLQFLYYNPHLGPTYFRELFQNMDVTFARNTRQMTDWLATGKFAICFGCLGVEKAKQQGLPVAIFKSDTTFKEGASVGPGSGTISLLNKAPNPNAAKVFVNWLLSREGQIAMQKLDEFGVHVNSARIDIPKDDVDPERRLVPGALYYDQNNPEWSNLDPIFALAKEIMANRQLQD